MGSAPFESEARQPDVFNIQRECFPKFWRGLGAQATPTGDIKGTESPWKEKELGKKKSLERKRAWKEKELGKKKSLERKRAWKEKEIVVKALSTKTPLQAPLNRGYKGDGAPFEREKMQMGKPLFFKKPLSKQSKKKINTLWGVFTLNGFCQINTKK